MFLSSSVFHFAVQTRPRIRSRNVSAPSALTVASELGVAAGTCLGEDMRPAVPVECQSADWPAGSSGKRSKWPSNSSGSPGRR